jgi:hypothetical protein
MNKKETQTDLDKYKKIIENLKIYEFNVYKKEEKYKQKINSLNSELEILNEKLQEERQKNKINSEKLNQLRANAVSILKTDIISTTEDKEKNQLIITIKK